MRESPIMPPIAATVGLLAIAIVCFVVGALQLPICGGGASLALFGIGVLILGLLASLSGGGVPSLGIASAFGIAFIVAGFIIQHGAGCPIGI